MRGIHLFMFIVLIPAIAAFGHDIYLFTQNSSVNEATQVLQEDASSAGSFFADLGFIWTEYEPDSYKQTVEMLEPEQWKVVNKVLAHKAVLVALAFAGAIYLLLFLLRLLKVWPFGENRAEKFNQNKRVDEIMGRSSGKKMKYKRK